MAKNIADNCMFCGEAPCVCNAAKKKATPKRAAKKVAPPAKAEEPKPQPVVETRQPAQPSMLTQRKPLDSSRKPIESGPSKVKPMSKAKQHTDKELDEFELTRVLRMFDFHGMLAPEEKVKHAARLRYPEPGPETKAILKRVQTRDGGGEESVDKDDNERAEEACD